MNHLVKCGGPDFTLRVGKPCHAESRRYAVRPCATAFTQLDVLSILIRSLPWCPLSCSQALEASSRVKNGPSSHMLLCRRRCSAVLTSVTNDEASYCVQCCRHPACAEVLRGFGDRAVFLISPNSISLTVASFVHHRRHELY